jgi:hypothetical protein
MRLAGGRCAKRARGFQGAGQAGRSEGAIGALPVRGMTCSRPEDDGHRIAGPFRSTPAASSPAASLAHRPQGRRHRPTLRGELTARSRSGCRSHRRTARARSWAHRELRIARPAALVYRYCPTRGQSPPKNRPEIRKLCVRRPRLRLIQPYRPAPLPARGPG